MISLIDLLEESLLLELFSGPSDYEVVRADKSKFITRQNIGKRDIIFLADLYDEGDADIEFAEVAKDTPIKDYSKKGTYALTGSGDEIKVFAMVAKSIKEMVSRYEPTKINFSAEKDGNGRRPSVYERMLKKSLPDYEITKYDSKVTGKHGAVLFTLYKK
jgi:hypothetical protein